MSSNLEFPACPLCRSEKRDIAFHLQDPYAIARCTACGLHYLYPRLVASAMQQIYCEPSYYEGGASGYSDGSYAFQESALRATFRQFLLNLRKRGLTGGHIIVATPDIGGVLRRAMGRRWPSFKTPEHVLYFDFPTLSAVLERAGLTNVRRLPYHHAFPMGLIAAKFGFTLPALLARLKVWVPATTIAAYGRVANR